MSTHVYASKHISLTFRTRPHSCPSSQVSTVERLLVCLSGDAVLHKHTGIMCASCVLIILCYWVKLTSKGFRFLWRGWGAEIWTEDKVTTSPKLRAGPGEVEGRAGPGLSLCSPRPALHAGASRPSVVWKLRGGGNALYWITDWTLPTSAQASKWMFT